VADVDLARLLAHELEPSLLSLHLRLRALAKENACRAEAEACLAEVEGLRLLVREFLFLGRRPLATGTFPLATILEALQHRFGPIAAARGIALEIEPTRERVEGDPRATERALSNLLDNAVKFSRAQGRVAVWTKESGETVVIRIEDQGIGIPLPEQQRVFEPFARLDPETPGAGLGLSIARDLAEGQGGRLSLVSEPGRGSTFVLTLRKA
jgi:signal transduction histidine kinase